MPNMKYIIVIFSVAALFLGGCGAEQLLAPGKGEKNNKEEEAGKKQSRDDRFLFRPPINTERNLYEGSLWKGASSWGNLIRDHRARYRGDLLTVREMGKIIKVPKLKAEPLRAEAGGAQSRVTEEPEPEILDPVLAYLRNQDKKRQLIDLEQNEILRSIDSIEVEVVRVMPNGNLIVRGNHPPIHRERNRVKYIVSLQGIVRPTDVDDKNTIPATKLSKAEYRIRRLVRRTLPQS